LCSPSVVIVFTRSIVDALMHILGYRGDRQVLALVIENRNK
jgi:hypothetical protein